MVQTRGAAKGHEQNKQHVPENEDQDHKVKPRAGKGKTSDKTPGEDDKTFTIPFGDKQITCERRGEETRPSLIFTHGAGGDISTPATSELASGFAEVATIILFNGSMNVKNRVKAFGTVADHHGFEDALGGRSMGARAACMAAVEEGRKTKALVLVSFPLVADKNKESREQVLLDLPAGTDVLFISGTKDSMCDLEHLQIVTEKMKARVWVVRVKDADHGMSWSYKDKDSIRMMRQTTGTIAAEWLQERDARTRYKSVHWEAETETLHCSGWSVSSDESDITQANKVEKPGEDEAPPAAKKRKRGKA
ncbi:hypothetical protein LTR78_002501 [Recurvomyces mirabilis]|uniref:KANL3/Tex30 alpha/beta hydrolase-like domain-containing protein n=1 Tax=Recurvomyces mirabilis TaxID=574656 RepID=A0AAE0WTT6_9PEZI|nr:hypothetical protein LTR78_002501 [Recurvomyces mirabilis]KAK5157430.1 hypothetical protein LTS14_004195 [Recurvomyces mirabilis]